MQCVQSARAQVSGLIPKISMISCVDAMMYARSRLRTHSINCMIELAWIIWMPFALDIYSTVYLFLWHMITRSRDNLMVRAKVLAVRVRYGNPRMMKVDPIENDSRLGSTSRGHVRREMSEHDVQGFVVAKVTRVVFEMLPPVIDSIKSEMLAMFHERYAVKEEALMVRCQAMMRKQICRNQDEVPWASGCLELLGDATGFLSTLWFRWEVDGLSVILGKFDLSLRGRVPGQVWFSH
ncbi:hypothetical protein L1887_39171 [Cichorium endivia]|nr:hypothetical protein L1887_39171 [Cichorium endivia]